MFADLRTRSTTTGTAGCSGWRSTRTSRPSPTSTSLYTYDARRSAAPPPALERRPARRRPGPTTDGCVVSGRLSRLTATGNVGRRRAGPDRGLVPAVPEPLDRRRSLRPRRRAVRRAAATARASTAPTTARTARRRTPAAIRPAAPAATTPPTAEGGALRPRTCRTAGDPTGAGRLDHPHRPGDRRRRCRATRSPPAPTPTRAGSSPTGCATRSASRSGPARTSSGSATSAGTLGGDRPDRQPDAAPSTNFGWPCYEGAGRQASLRRAEPQHLQRPVRAARRGHPAVLHLQPRRRTLSPARPARPALVDHRAGLLPGRRLPGRTTTARCSSPTTPATASGSMPARLQRAARPLHGRDLRSRRGQPGRPRDRPRRRSLLRRTSTAASIQRIQYFGIATSRRSRLPTRLADEGAAPLTVQFDGSRVERPEPRRHPHATPGTSTGTAPSATRPWPRPACPTPVGTYVVRLQVTDSLGLSTISDPITISAGNTAPAPVITSPDSSSRGPSATRSPSPAPRRTRRTRRWPPRGSAGR